MSRAPSLPPAIAVPPHTRADERNAQALVVFLQMFPATLIAPAVRPLFVRNHAGHEGAMHAFMSVNMVGAAVAAAILAASPSLRERIARHASALVALDAVAIALVAAPFPLGAVLATRTLEGALHVTTATLLFAHAAGRAKETGDRRGVALVGAALTFAVALGHLAGAALVGLDARAPFLTGGLLLGALVPFVGPLKVARGHVRPVVLHRARPDASATARDESPARSFAASRFELVLATSAAFVARFTVGCLVVTFALFAHRAHHLSDRTIGALFAAMTLPFACTMYPAGLVAARGARATSLLGAMTVYAALLAMLGRVPSSALGPAMVGMGIASAFIFASVLALATAGRTGAARTRAIACVNGAGSLGMLLGPAAGGITCALFRSASDPCRGYSAAFVLAASSAAIWTLVSLPALARLAATEAAGAGTPRWEEGDEVGRE